jgi:hypothetical protein
MEMRIVDAAVFDQVVQQLEDVEDELLKLVEDNPRLIRHARVLEGVRHLQNALSALKGMPPRASAAPQHQPFARH